MPRWSKNRVVLIGDACAAVSPLAAHGASLAVGSAYVLAEQLRLNSSVDRAVNFYERLWRWVIDEKQHYGRDAAGWTLPASPGQGIRRGALRLTWSPLVSVSSQRPWPANRTPWLRSFVGERLTPTGRRRPPDERLEPESRASATQIAFELGGDCVAVDLAERLVDIGCGVAVLLQRSTYSVSSSSSVAIWPTPPVPRCLGLGREVTQRHPDIEHFLDATQQRHGCLRVRGCHLARHCSPERHGRDTGRQCAGVLEYPCNSGRALVAGLLEAEQPRRLRPESRLDPRPAPAWCAVCQPAARPGSPRCRH